MPIRAEQRGLTRELNYSDYVRDKPSTVELTWGKSLGDVIEEIGVVDEIKTALEGIITVTDSIGDLLDLAQAAVDFLILVVGRAIVDLASALIVALEAALTTFTNLFTGLSVNILDHFPQTYKSRRSPSEILYDMGTAYLDAKDNNRPIMADQVFGVALVGVISLPNLQSLLRRWDQIVRIIKSLGEDFLSLNPLTEGARFSSVDETWQTTLESDGHSGIAPDFNVSLSLLDFNFFKTIVDSLSDAIRLMKKGKSYEQKIRSVLALAQRRIAQVNSISQRILTAINSMAAFLAIGEGFSLLRVQGTGTNEDFARAIINAPLHPAYPKSDLIDNINNLAETQGLENPIDTALGEKGLYSGGLVLHFQVPNTPENVQSLDALMSLMFKSNVEDIRESSSQQSQRLKDANDNLFS